MSRVACFAPGLKVWVSIPPVPRRLARVVGMVDGSLVRVEFHPSTGLGLFDARPDQLLAYDGPPAIWPEDVRRFQRRYAA